MKQQITLPMPPSVNRYYRSIGRGRVIISEDGRNYRNAVKQALLVARAKHIKGRIGIELELCFTDKRSCDLDNRIKSLQDALQKAGLFDDDSQIDLLMIRRGQVIKGGVANLTIWEIV